jgi:hypothetical protein
VKQILKRLGGVLGTEEVVDRAADELDKSYPGLSRKILIIIVSSSIGAITTWGIAIDGRVYDLKEAVALRQTIVEERKLLLALEQRVSDRANEVDETIGELKQKIDALYCKVYEQECKFHGAK